MEDDFKADELDRSLWFPYYLPHWSSREASRARYVVGGSLLRLRIEADQPPWCPEFDGWLRVSSLQTALFAGQHRFGPDLVVREDQPPLSLFTQQYGRFEIRARAIADPANMVSLWMIGLEDQPGRSAEICVFEIYGRDVRLGSALVGLGIHPFGDPKLQEDFTRVEVGIDATEFHVYTADWTAAGVNFLIDGVPVKVVEQSPDYPMQLMLGVYEFAEGPDLVAGPYPKEFTIDWVRVLV